jgi:hypothetical protein
MDVPRPDGLPPLRIYRVLEDRPWHQHGARNLAAREANGSWLFLTDMDHVLPAESLAVLLERVARVNDGVFLFHRLDAPDLTPKMKNGVPHPHTNTFAVRKAHFWALGGYDEDLQGYATDGYFLRRLKAHGTTLLMDAPIVRYSREVIPDASMRAPDGVDPYVFRRQAKRTVDNDRVIAEKLAAGLPPTVMNFPWEQSL